MRTRIYSTVLREAGIHYLRLLTWEIRSIRHILRKGPKSLQNEVKALLLIRIHRLTRRALSMAVARKLEGLLGIFSHQICSERSRGMKELINLIICSYN